MAERLRPRARGRAATETLLEQAALRLLEREGVLAGLRLQDVAEEAAVSRGLINHYFGSRRELLRKALASKQAASEDKFRGQRTRGRHSVIRWGFRRGIRDRQYAMILALLAIDGDETLEALPWLDEEVAQRREQMAAGEVVADFDPEVTYAIYMALGVGWSLLRSSFARQIDVPLDELDARAETVLVRMADTFLT